jgi:hypothetical protein
MSGSVAGQLPLIACSLDTAGQRARLSEWAELLSRAAAVSAGYVPIAQGGGRLHWEGVGVEEVLDAHGGERRLVDE